MPHSFDEVCGAVARGWCAPENSGKEMDVDLAAAISKEVWKLICGVPKYNLDEMVAKITDENRHPET